MARNLQELIPAFFVGPNGEQLTPDQIKQRQAVAESLMAQATDTSPNAGGWLSVAAKGMQGLAAGRQRNQADEAVKANALASQERMSSLLGGLGGSGSTAPAMLGGVPVNSTPDPVSSRVNTAHQGGVAPEVIREGLIARGLPPHVAEGFVLNFQDESGLNPGINEAAPIVPGSRGGFGLYQLTGPRRVEYEQFAQDRGVPLDSVDAQLDFLMKEGSGSEKAAFDRILASPDTATAATEIVNRFLRPAPEHRASRSARYAQAPNFVAPDATMTAFAPSAEVVGALASAPFPSAGLPVGDVMDDEVIVAETPEDIIAAEAAMNSPEFAQPVDYLSLPENQLSMEYADEIQPMAASAPDAGIWGMGMDPNDPSTIPAMAGGTLDIISGSDGGNFPAAPGMAQQSQGGMGGINPAIIEALSSPYASPQERQIASLLLGEQMQAQDPMRQLQLQKMQAEVEQMRTGTPGASSSFGNLDAQARAAGLVPGSPEYQDFMLHGGGAPATFRALDMQAQAAGFTPGTPEYNEFMATRGAGLQAGAAQTAKNVADIESGGAAAGAIDLGKASIKAGTDAWADYGKLQTSIGNLDEAIAAIDSGAQSGAIYKLLPNITEASASLQNAMDRMGLDVIGSVTFGALSEAEMRLAMQTAAPRDLAPADLRNWLVRKREAQANAADMLADAAQFLTRPGNTINGWIEKNRAAKEAAPISATPPIDANKPVADMTDEELEAFINGN